MNDVNNFWIRYRDTVIQCGIPEFMADWYVKWEQKFAVSMKGKPLRQRNVDDIQKFLLNLSNRKNIQKWQIEQAQEALIILYNNYLKRI